MAYDAAKAHEYYMNYRKKGLKKKRQKEKIAKDNIERSTKPTKAPTPLNNGINKGEVKPAEKAKEAYNPTDLSQKKQKLQGQIDALKKKLDGMSEDEKAQVKLELKDKINELKRKLNRNNAVLNQFKG